MKLQENKGLKIKLQECKDKNLKVLEFKDKKLKVLEFKDKKLKVLEFKDKKLKVLECKECKVPNQLKQIKHKNLSSDNHMMWVNFKIVHLGDTLDLGLRFLGN